MTECFAQYEKYKVLPGQECFSLNSAKHDGVFVQLAKYFGVTVNYLLGIKDNMEEDNSRTAIIFRKAEQVDPKEKEKLLDILDSTIDIFLGNNKNG